MKTQRQARAYIDPIHHGFDFNRLRVSLSSQRQEDIDRVLETFVGKRFVSSDGIALGNIIDVLISDWDHRAKYIKCRVEQKNFGKSPRLIYYPIKYLSDLVDTGVVASHSLRELIRAKRFQPAAVRQDELFPLVSLMAYASHVNKFQTELIGLH